MDFADAVHFDFDTALMDTDDRDDYGECREIAIGWCGLRLCCLVFVQRDDGGVRVIGFRKATKKEVRRYANS